MLGFILLRAEGYLTHLTVLLHINKSCVQMFVWRQVVERFS